MHRFTIKDIENMCAIKAHTLRVWEQRYDFFKPHRKESKHRYYDNEDLKALLRIACLYHGGWKVSRIAALDNAAVIAEVTAIWEKSPLFEQDILSLLDASIDFDESRFGALLDGMIRARGMEETIVNIAYPFLKRVGLLWMTNHVIPAHEHFSSYLVQHKIIAETNSLPAPATDAPLIAVFAPHGEHHELPLLFINFLLKKWGWKTIYLGVNLGLRDLPEALTAQATHLYLHLITNFTGFEVDDYLEALCRANPGKIVAASGVSVHVATRSFVNLRVLRSDSEINKFIRQMPLSAEHNS
jgi:DNA-binding transcriptional MerR regulator